MASYHPLVGDSRDHRDPIIIGESGLGLAGLVRQPTAYAVHARHVTSMTVKVTGVYPTGASSDVAIAEVELFGLS